METGSVLQTDNGNGIPLAFSAAGTAGTAGLMIGMTEALTYPAFNLGGYITAQKMSSLVGLGGPMVAETVASAGGPVVAGLIAAVAAGLLLYGIGKLLLRLFRWVR